ncbi:MAG: 2-octaprenyl-6-methoxyphenyl hydroxylase [Povalibacter sp.]
MKVDVAIAGGGLVGASLALALSSLKLKVALLEAHPFGTSGQPSFDDRTTALSNGSRRIFEAIGVWPLIEREATGIRRVHISDQGRFGFARIDAKEQNLAALGFVVTNRIMGAALWRRLQEQAVEVIAPARVIDSEIVGDHRELRCEIGAEASVTLHARLVIAADGAQSVVREAAGIAATTWDYEQHALVTNVFTQRFHDHVAYERFTASGPLALLPMTEGRMGLIWTFAPSAAAEMQAATDEVFLSRLQDAFGFRLGRFTRVGARQIYPLALTRAEEHIAPRLVVVGNAAQSLHPIAGQGFNLGLRDAASIAEVLADALAASHASVEFDAGDGLLLNRYREWRGSDRQKIVGFTDGLVRLFTQPFGPVKFARDLGLLTFDLMPAAKDALSQLSLGASGRIPRLARGGTL